MARLDKEQVERDQQRAQREHDKAMAAQRAQTDALRQELESLSRSVVQYQAREQNLMKEILDLRLATTRLMSSLMELQTLAQDAVDKHMEGAQQQYRPTGGKI